MAWPDRPKVIPKRVRDAFDIVSPCTSVRQHLQQPADVLPDTAIAGRTVSPQPRPADIQPVARLPCLRPHFRARPPCCEEPDERPGPAVQAANAAGLPVEVVEDAWPATNAAVSAEPFQHRLIEIFQAQTAMMEPEQKMATAIARTPDGSLRIAFRPLLFQEGIQKAKIVVDLAWSGRPAGLLEKLDKRANAAHELGHLPVVNPVAFERRNGTCAVMLDKATQNGVVQRSQRDRAKLQPRQKVLRRIPKDDDPAAIDALAEQSVRTLRDESRGRGRLRSGAGGN